MTQPTAARYGRYQVVKLLGRGSMGEVYEAYDPRIDQPLALKVLRRDRVSDQASSRRFLNEAKGAGRLRSHPHIVTVYDVGEDQGTVYIAMELLQGRPLNDVARERRLELAEVARIGAQIADALQFAHDKGIVHRDIKPSNLILEADGRIKVTDFGIAHIQDAGDLEQTQVGEILGTPAYMSPEQTRGRQADGRSDIFSLGVVLYELATGARPFSGQSIDSVFTQIQTAAPPAPNRLAPDLPRAFSRLLLKCLEKDPDRRFQSARDLAQELAPFARDREPDEPRRRRSRYLPILAGIFVVTIAGGVYFLYDHLWGQVRAQVTIASVPDAAEVAIGGRVVGKTPVALRLNRGKFEVRVSKEGYYDWEAQLQLTDAETVPLDIELLPIPAQAE